jgi:hypothetical protein
MQENRVRNRQNTATAVQPYIPRKEGYLGKKYGAKGYRQRWLEIGTVFFVFSILFAATPHRFSQY